MRKRRRSIGIGCRTKGGGCRIGRENEEEIRGGRGGGGNVGKAQKGKDEVGSKTRAGVGDYTYPNAVHIVLLNQ